MKVESNMWTPGSEIKGVSQNHQYVEHVRTKHNAKIASWAFNSISPAAAGHATDKNKNFHTESREPNDV